jgi:hypothetical protein
MYDLFYYRLPDVLEITLQYRTWRQARQYLFGILLGLGRREDHACVGSPG